MTIHKNNVCPALIYISGGIVEGGVVINLPGPIANGKVRVIKGVVAIALYRPSILFGECDHLGGMINLRLFCDPRHT